LATRAVPRTSFAFIGIVGLALTLPGSAAAKDDWPDGEW